MKNKVFAPGLARAKLQPLPEKKTLSGFRNMLKIENSRWWNKKNILTQSIVWLLSVNFIVSMPILVARAHYKKQFLFLNYSVEILKQKILELSLSPTKIPKPYARARQ